MKNFKPYLKYLEFSTIFLLISNLLISTLYYFNILGNNTVSISRMVSVILCMFISGYELGKGKDKKGYIEGIKFGLIIISIFLVISLIFFRDSIRPRLFIYDLILLSITTLGSMIGISKKKD